MSLYVKEWPDHTASLLTEDGRVVWTFPSLDDVIAEGYDIDDGAMQGPQPARDKQRASRNPGMRRDQLR